MFALDLFNNDHERHLSEGSVDRLEQRRIDDLAMKMDDLVARAKTATTPEVKAALVKEFQKCKAERDSYFKIKDECMGYGGLGEAGIGQDIANKTEKMARATPSTPTGKVASTVKNAAKWLAGKGGPGKEGPTYEGADDAWQKEGPWTKTPKAKSGKPVDPRGEVTHLSDVARREAMLKAQDQKKNSKEVDEAGGGWALDPKTKLELKKRRERQKTIAKWAGRPVPPQEKEIKEDQRLSVGDPIIVTAPNEFEGKTGEIAEFSPSGKFVIVNLYNHGEQPMHLSDVEYNQYADDEDEIDEDLIDAITGYAADMYNGEQGAEVVAKAVKTALDETVNPQFINSQVTKLLARATQTGNFASISQLLAPLMKQYNLTLQQIDTIIPGGLKQAAGEYGVAMKEGFQDFNKVEPYAVCLAGKPVKKFDYYEQARRFHDNWKQKLYREGNKAKADKITLLPLGLDEAGVDRNAQPEPSGITKKNEFNILEPKSGTPVPAKDFVKGVLKDLKKVNVKEAEGDFRAVIRKVMSKVHVDGGGGNLSYMISQQAPTMDMLRDVYHDDIERMLAKAHPNELKKAAEELKAMFTKDVAEAETDYSKRRQRERDVDAGKPVTKQREPRMTDYQKRRAQDKKDMALGEDQDTSGVESAIIRRIMVAHTDLLKQFGPQKVMQAAEEVAYNVGDVDEIGTSDVSAYVDQVRQILGA